MTLRRLIYLQLIAVAAIAASILVFQRAAAQTCSTTSFPYTLTNGTTADASQVTADLNCAAIYGLANWSGNVGIGNTNPAAPLDVGGYLHVTGSVNPIVNAQGAYFNWNVTGGVGETDFINNKGLGGGGFYFVNSTALTTPLMFIAASGNVGIATSNPVYTFDVHGYSHFLASSANQITIDTTAGGEQGTILFNSNGAAKFQMGKQADDTFFIYDAINTRTLISTTTTGLLYLGENSQISMPNSGNVGIYTPSPSYPLYVNGQAGGTTSWANTFDRRLKKNIVEITGALALVQKLRGVRFDWKRPKERTVGKTLRLPQGEHEMGFIAQEVAKVVPEAVAAPKPGKDNLYGVKEADLVPLLVQAIKEQQQEIAKLQSTVAALQQTISKQSH